MGVASGLLAGLLTIAAGPIGSPSAPRFVEVTVRGKVVPLGSALKSLGVDVKPDPEPLTREIVLLADDRSITPLFRDDASRAFFLDERMRDRRVEIRGRRFPGVPYLQVSTYQVEIDGRFQTPEYFCTVCSITELYPQTCPCCQGPMELRWKVDPQKR